jgi:hypothetical protein
MTVMARENGEMSQASGNREATAIVHMWMALSHYR